jgi:hypothetical protein
MMDDVTQEMMAALAGEKEFEASLDLETKPEGTTVPAVEATPETPATPPIEEKPVVLAKDGVHTIPYSVVEGLRERERQLAARIAELERTGTTETVVDDLPDVSAEDMELLREEFPDAIKRMDALESRIKRQAELESRLAAHEQTAKQTAAEVAQAAIDSIPKLAHIQANNPDLFAKACELDAQLGATNPNMPLAERFQKAMSAVEVLYGDVVLPGDTPAAQQSAPVAPVKPVIPAPKVPIPNSLSDLPAGSPPIHDPLAALSAVSAPTLLGHFHGKTPSQIEDELRALI